MNAIPFFHNFLNQLCRTVFMLHISLVGINEYEDSTLSVEDFVKDTFQIDYHYRYLFYLRSAIR